MKGLMVSLIIVIFAAVTSDVMAATQQDAAGFKPQLGLQSNEPLERPGPDDSDDKVDWPTPISRSSSESTNTSQTFGDRQFGSPAPESAMDTDIRFDVKVSKDAIQMLRQGRQVFSPVEVRDTSDTELHPSVVSDIALFLDTNAGRQDLKGVRLDPLPMELGSTTLRFEIPANELEHFEEDAFLFNVPDSLRGKFNRVEFFAGKAPTGSHDFPVGLTSGPRGSGSGFGNLKSNGGLVTNPADRFSSTNQNQQRNTNTPQMGPVVEPGDPRYNGPYIAASERQARRPLAPLNDNLNSQSDFAQRNDQVRSPLDTGGQFRVANRESDDLPKRSRFSLPPNNRSLIGRDQNGFQQNTSPSANNQGYQESVAQQQLRQAQQKLADAEAEKKSLLQNASEWKREAGVLAQQRNDLSKRLQAGYDQVASRPLNTQPVNYEQPRVDSPYLSRPTNFGDREPTQAELDRRKMEEYENKLKDLEEDNRRLFREGEDAKIRLAASQDQSLQRPSADKSRPQLYNTGYRTDVQNQDGSYRTANADTDPKSKRKQFGAGNAGQDSQTYGDNAELANDGAQGPGAKRKGSSDALWLVGLLLFSVGLNVFLWLHSRTLYLRYDELADELRGMVGASTM